MNRRQRVCLLASALVLGPLAMPIAAQDRQIVYRVPVTGVIELGLAPLAGSLMTSGLDQ